MLDILTILNGAVQNSGLEVRVMDSAYPSMLPRLVMKSVFGKEVPAGSGCEAVGAGFINAEAVVSLGKAFAQSQVPVHKLLTVIRKNGSLVHVRTRIGTPVRDVLLALQIDTAHGDRVVLGGPMTGRALLSEETPVLYDTDAVMVQDREEIVNSSDTHCVNCGECVRACPAHIPVNMLIRFLENGMWTKNHVNFQFKGGAADELRKNRRARVIQKILEELGFLVEVVADRVTARLVKQEQRVIEDKLDHLGRLLIFTRQMDMLMSSEDSVNHLAECFLKGDYCMESVPDSRAAAGSNTP